MPVISAMEEVEIGGSLFKASTQEVESRGLQV
jgi:hypothetical protein